MKNHVRTKSSLSEQDEDICVDIFRNIMRLRHLMHKNASSVAARVALHAAELNVIDTNILITGNATGRSRIDSSRIVT